MKYCMIVFACILVAGCVTKGPRFNPNAKLKPKQTCCIEKNCCQKDKQVEKKKKVSHGDALGERIAGAKKRIQTAVKEGKMTPEQGKEMMDALKKRVREGRKTRGK